MKKIKILLSGLTVFGLMTGCGGSGGSNTNVDASEISMILTPMENKEGKVKFSLGGSDAATIDWGDGSPVDSITLGRGRDFEHSYTQLSEYTIKITGENITDLFCPGCNITKLNLNVSTLTSLYCYYNELTTLDVSKNTELERLSCLHNHLTSLDVSQNTELRILACDGNELTSLDVSKNTKLDFLDCSSNKLTSLDVSKNPDLETLYCSFNQLTSLDISNHPELRRLNCWDNRLTSLNVNNTESLYDIYSPDNQLSAEALNAVFRTLCNSGTIYIGGNPGTKTCNRNIAEEKGWMVEEYDEGD